MRPVTSTRRLYGQPHLTSVYGHQPHHSSRARTAHAGESSAQPARGKRAGKNTAQVFPDAKSTQKPMPVTVENQGAQGMVTDNIGAVTEVVLTLIFIPFLTYFMLSWREHARTKSVQIFRPEHRTTAYVTLG